MTRRGLFDLDVDNMPEWLWLLAPVVFVGAIVASVFYPWGWAL